MTLSTSTRQKIRQIRGKYKDPITKKPSCASDDAVIAYAVETLHEDLMNRGESTQKETTRQNQQSFLH